LCSTIPGFARAGAQAGGSMNDRMLRLITALWDFQTLPKDELDFKYSDRAKLLDETQDMLAELEAIKYRKED